jgi:hypothetical protein
VSFFKKVDFFSLKNYHSYFKTDIMWTNTLSAFLMRRNSTKHMEGDGKQWSEVCSKAIRLP